MFDLSKNKMSFYADSAEGVLFDVIQHSGILTENIKEEVEKYEKSKPQLDSDNSDYNTNSLNPEHDDLVNHVSSLTSFQASEIEDFCSDWKLDDDVLVQGKSIDTSYVNILNEEEIAKPLSNRAVHAEDFNDPYKELEAEEKLMLLWSFLHRRIDSASSRSKVAAKFNLTDEDMASLSLLENNRKKLLALFTYRMRIQNLVESQHMWTFIIDEKLEKVIDIFVDELEKTTEEPDVLSNSVNSSVSLMNVEEKNRLVNGALSNIGSEEKRLRRAGFKILNDYSFDEKKDIEYIKNNISQLVKNNAETSDKEKEKKVQKSFFSETFTCGDGLLYPGLITDVIWNNVGIDSFESSDIPPSERNRITRELLKNIAVIWAESGSLPNPSRETAFLLIDSEKNREYNNKPSFYDQILELKERYEKNGTFEHIESSDEAQEFDSPDNDGLSEAEKELYAELFGSEEEYQESEDDYSLESFKDSSDSSSVPEVIGKENAVVKEYFDESDTGSFGYFGDIYGFEEYESVFTQDFFFENRDENKKLNIRSAVAHEEIREICSQAKGFDEIVEKLDDLIERGAKIKYYFSALSQK